ncbi:MAG: hypothetical protein CL605_02435 [Altibacter sp.]|uniref:hypothetical protein n=1 Tax=Altibacter sp. TaxID=2024823 RepID=UPI000C8F0D50|nr:hypothetical protein [Altibacter sp.]MAP53739.1 hypothetical protein [Altibacter sp.]|tara:strand:- start:36331 stop:36582 length:252 start_codon:yes stop_codon:yes gene_type:complete
MTWEDIVKKRDMTGGMNSIVDFIARLKEIATEMEEIAKESFSEDAPIVSFNIPDAKDLLDDYKKFSKSVEVLFQKMIEQGERA